MKTTSFEQIVISYSTVSYELSRKLERIFLNNEVKRNSYFGWLKKSAILVERAACENNGFEDVIAAFTLDEILEMLPVIKKEDITYYPLIHRSVGNLYCAFYVDYHINRHLYIRPHWEKNNPAEAAGQLLVWCIENGYVKPEELNATI